jgi:hypothetical protein
MGEFGPDEPQHGTPDRVVRGYGDRDGADQRRRSRRDEAGIPEL